MGAGRPARFNEFQSAKVAKVLAKFGLTKGRQELIDTGVQMKPGLARESQTVSIPTLMKIADQYGVEFTRGRPTLKKSKKTKTVAVVAPATFNEAVQGLIDQIEGDLVGDVAQDNLPEIGSPVDQNQFSDLPLFQLV